MASGPGPGHASTHAQIPLEFKINISWGVGVGILWNSYLALTMVSVGGGQSDRADMQLRRSLSTITDSNDLLGLPRFSFDCFVQGGTESYNKIIRRKVRGDGGLCVDNQFSNN